MNDVVLMILSGLAGPFMFAVIHAQFSWQYRHDSFPWVHDNRCCPTCNVPKARVVR